MYFFFYGVVEITNGWLIGKGTIPTWAAWAGRQKEVSGTKLMDLVSMYNNFIPQDRHIKDKIEINK